NGDRGVVLHAFGDQERRTRWVVENARHEAERGEARHHLVVEIAAQRGCAVRLLARARDGDPPPQIDEKFAAGGIAVRASGGGCALESIPVADYGPQDIACGPLPRQGRWGDRACSKSCIWMNVRRARWSPDGASRSS